MPPNVRAEVDGKDAVATGGTITLSGPLGSTHHVRISSDGREKQVDVVLAEDGVLPALVDLGPPPTPRATPAAPRRAVAAAPTPREPDEPAEPKKNPLRMDMK